VRKRITVPETLSDITIGQYLELVNLPEGQDPAEQMADTLRIACGISPEDIRNMENADLVKIVGILSGILEGAEDAEFIEFIELDGVRYGFHPNLAKVTVGEFSDLEMLTKDTTKHLATICGILYRPVIEEHAGFYAIEPYDGEDRGAIFTEAPASLALGALGFFLSAALKLQHSLANYSKEAKGGQSPINGDGLPLSLRWREKTLPNSMPSNGSRLTWLSRFWHTNKTNGQAKV
jgi:hypothetical protein